MENYVITLNMNDLVLCGVCFISVLLFLFVGSKFIGYLNTPVKIPTVDLLSPLGKTVYNILVNDKLFDYWESYGNKLELKFIEKENSKSKSHNSLSISAFNQKEVYLNLDGYEIDNLTDIDNFILYREIIDLRKKIEETDKKIAYDKAIAKLSLLENGKPLLKTNDKFVVECGVKNVDVKKIMDYLKENPMNFEI